MGGLQIHILLVQEDQVAVVMGTINQQEKMQLSVLEEVAEHQDIQIVMVVMVVQELLYYLWRDDGKNI